ncbi:(S)-benzoin forming benzil reductase [Pullulanibacillus sp. KACC 23026]|uniref:(S)-benzoin forming benzil reductase n=1 Tax=Pullulanibacillus sp. KACC 23026 TaxID=3028315 RepID=UPI0023AE8227|nr:(S)-benzoin forming benzil reductase [Pullulanibacillus sp. KACC 23026]WEG12321.1 (S)-benzoin forming benzil reductase [Pullulanibacillus sp. KACC 23026]
MGIYIITGVSRGLGESIVKQLIEPGNQIICISRKPNDKLEALAKEHQVALTFYPCDLNESGSIEQVCQSLYKNHDWSGQDKIVLINNAGVVEPIKQIGQADSQDLIQNIRVNLIAPLLLCNWFIKTFSGVPAEKLIVNVSSGAAEHPYDGWAAYCSSKAGVDMLTKTIALEQRQAPHPVQVISFSPGVMDTDMQGEIRASDETQFSNVERFREFKEKGQLRSPDLVAEKLLGLLGGNIESGRVYNIQEFV